MRFVEIKSEDQQPVYLQAASLRCSPSNLTLAASANRLHERRIMSRTGVPFAEYLFPFNAEF